VDPQPANVNPNGFIGFLLNQLTWPEWQFAPKNDSAGATREMLANDLRALLIIVFVFGILAMVAKGIGSGGVGFIVGWVALILGAALAAFLTYFLKTTPRCPARTPRSSPSRPVARTGCSSAGSSA
jgi:hypothetical protein